MDRLEETAAQRDEHREVASALVDDYVAAQLVGNRRAALEVILETGLARGLPVPELYFVIMTAQHQIGVLWQENRISVAQEHIATAISQLALAHLYPVLPRAEANGKQVLVACVAEELHDMGARMVSDFFEMAGFDVRFLGASVPTESLAAMVRESSPDLLVLSATMRAYLSTLRQAVSICREAGGDRLRVGVGGHALATVPQLEAQLGIEVRGDSAAQTVRMARQVFGLNADV